MVLPAPWGATPRPESIRRCGLTQAGRRCDTAAIRASPSHRAATGSGHPRIGFALLVLAADLLRQQAARIDALQQDVATLKRSDQISRQANTELQGTLAERDEEIASLRADIAFYERFVGATAQRRGLSVHELALEPQRDPQVWHFVATLTQNLNRGAVNRGRLLLSVEASDGGRMHKLAWGELRQQRNAPGIEYSFKYFQQVEGDLLLPAGVKPVRVIARLVPASGAAVEQGFTWSQATGGTPAGR